MEKNSADELLKLIAAETGVPRKELTTATKLAGLVTDSLEMANLILELEGACGIEIEVHEGITVADVLKLMEAKK